jgi:hypothetical protein
LDLQRILKASILQWLGLCTSINFSHFNLLWSIYFSVEMIFKSLWFLSGLSGSSVKSSLRNYCGHPNDLVYCYGISVSQMICSVCGNHSLVLSSIMTCHLVTRVTWGMPLVLSLLTLPDNMSSTLAFSGVRVVQPFSVLFFWLLAIVLSVYHRLQWWNLKKTLFIRLWNESLIVNNINSTNINKTNNHLSP